MHNEYPTLSRTTENRQSVTQKPTILYTKAGIDVQGKAPATAAFRAVLSYIEKKFNEKLIIFLTCR